MGKQLFLFISLIIVLGLAQNASAAEINWTNNAPDSNSWCEALNWNPNTAVPGSSDTAMIRNPNRGPIIDCGVDVGVIDGPSSGQEMDVISGIVNIAGAWDWSAAGGTATINISGSPTIDITGAWTPPKNGAGVLNISGNPTITVGGAMRGANDGGSSFEMNMSGGSLTVGARLFWGDDGGGELNVSGGATIECAEFDYTGESGADWVLNLNGGTITVSGRMRIPEKIEGAGKGKINLDAGTLECGVFAHAEVAYAMDINEGMFIIDGDVKTALDADVAAGYITAFNGTEDVSVTYDAGLGKTIVKADYVVLKATNPSPGNFAQNQCPGVELSWLPGEYADVHDIYFGTSLDDVNESATPVVSDHDSNSWSGGSVGLGQTYYWRVDQVNDAYDPYVWTGDIWQFSTNDGNALEPYPQDQQTAVARDVVLEWTAGCLALTHDVYFGTDFDRVRDATTAQGAFFMGNQGGTTYDHPGTLEILTDYYWRIDEVHVGTTYKGDVWSFRSQSLIADPHLIVWYKFDETEGTIASDSSGYEHHGSGYNFDNQWEPNDGHIDGCVDLEAEEHVLVPSSTLDAVTSEITVSVWINGDPGQSESDDMAVFDAGDLGGGGNYKLTGVVPTDGPELDVRWRAGNDSNDQLLWESASPAGWRGEWHHFGFVKDENAGTMKIYFDGLLAKSKSGTISSLVNVKGKTFKIGAFNNASSDYDGKLDDFRVYDRALSDNEIAGLFIGEDIELAWGANPFNGQSNVTLDANLTWRSGQFAVSHDVYFGTDWDDVNDGDSTLPVGTSVYKGRQNLEANSYDPGILQFDTTYYWRIDEVNESDANSPWKGKIWKFTVANFIVIDDMESYDPFNNIIWWVWANPDSTGSYIDLGTSPWDPVNNGLRSMEFPYDNSNRYGYGYYSETVYTFDSPQDWTISDIKMLTLFFYGDPNNDANSSEQMYVGLEDSDTDYFDIDYAGDMNNINLQEWQEWNIPLPDFTGVDQDAIKKIYIGFGDPAAVAPGGEGVVYFDDIRIYPNKCIPELGPALDFSGDCIVGFAEVAMMGDDWLMSDMQLTGITAPDPCVLHYKFDESSGTTVGDNSGNVYTGEVFGDLNQTPAEISTRMDPGKSGNSFHFSHVGEIDECGIKIPPEVFTDNAISQEITVAVWIKNAYPDENPDGVAFMWEFRQWDGISPDANARVLAVETADDGETYIFHDNSEDVSYDLDWDNHTEWTHYSFVRDAGNLAIYVNGILQEVSGSSGIAMETPDLLYLGITADRAPGSTEGMHDGFTGNMDDFIIYDYALPAAQIGHLGTGGTGYVPMEPSIMDLYDGEAQGEKAVNFRDYAVLMEKWLEKKYWPQ